jgi:hypothetical protein
VHSDAEQIKHSKVTAQHCLYNAYKLLTHTACAHAAYKYRNYNGTATAHMLSLSLLLL